MRVSTVAIKHWARSAWECAIGINDVLNELALPEQGGLYEGDCLVDALAAASSAIDAIPDSASVLTALEAGVDALWQSAITPGTTVLAQVCRVALDNLDTKRIRPVEVLEMLERTSVELTRRATLPHDKYGSLARFSDAIAADMARRSGEANLGDLRMGVCAEALLALADGAGVEFIPLAVLIAAIPGTGFDDPVEVIQASLQGADKAPQTTRASRGVLWLRRDSSSRGEIALGSACGFVAHRNCGFGETELALALDSVGLDTLSSLQVQQLFLCCDDFIAATGKPKRSGAVITLEEVNAIERPRLLLVTTGGGDEFEFAQIGANVARVDTPQRLWRIMRALRPDVLIAADPVASELAQTAKELTAKQVQRATHKTPTLFDLGDDFALGIEVPATQSEIVANTSLFGYTAREIKNQIVVPPWSPRETIFLECYSLVETVLLVQALAEPVPQALSASDRSRLLEGRASYVHTRMTTDPREVEILLERGGNVVGVLPKQTDRGTQDWGRWPDMTIVRLSAAVEAQLGGLPD